MTNYILHNHTYYQAGTPNRVITMLESARKDRLRIRIFYGFTAKNNHIHCATPDRLGEAWTEENNVLGYVGRSTGRVPVPLLVNNKRSLGGDAISTASIVAIKQGDNWLYKHPNFTTGVWTIQPVNKPPANYPFLFTVYHNGIAHAGMETEAKALRYAAFMRGDRNSK